ncbi:FMN-binding negative transcriptional regulator [Flavobacteriaceae bacterium M23B6Z8]
MYIPTYYKNEDPEAIREFLRRHEFAVLVNQAQGKLWGTHIPLQLGLNDQGKEVLLGHVSRGNQQWKSLETNQEVLAIFQGPHHYISSSWYDHENVPTWNYMAVHVYGKARLIEGEALWKVLKNLIDTYEANQARPVRLENISERLVRKEMKGIKGFEIEITDIQAQFKLSQGHSTETRKNVEDQLYRSLDSSAIEVAEAMKKHAPEK